MRQPRALFILAVAATVSLAPPASSQDPPPQGPPPNRGFAEGDRPGPQPDRFPLALAMRAIDEKVSVLLEQGKTDAALVEMRRAFVLDVPRESPAYEMKAHLIGRFAITLTNAGRKKEGVETIQRLLGEVPAGGVAEATAWLDAGTVYRQAGMPDEALKAFDRSIELAQKLAKTTRGPAGRPPQPPPGGRPPRYRAQPPRGEIP